MSQIVATTQHGKHNIMVGDKFHFRDRFESRCKYSKIWKAKLFNSQIIVGSVGSPLCRALLSAFFKHKSETVNIGGNNYNNFAALCAGLPAYFKEHTGNYTMEGSEAIVILNNEIFVIMDDFGVSWQAEPIVVIGAGLEYTIGAYCMWKGKKSNCDISISPDTIKKIMRPAIKYSGYVKPGYCDEFDVLTQPKQEI